MTFIKDLSPLAEEFEEHQELFSRISDNEVIIDFAQLKYQVSNKWKMKNEK